MSTLTTDDSMYVHNDDTLRGACWLVIALFFITARRRYGLLGLP